jgi:hypothetical protein
VNFKTKGALTTDCGKENEKKSVRRKKGINCRQTRKTLKYPTKWSGDMATMRDARLTCDLVRFTITRVEMAVGTSAGIVCGG